MREHTYVEVMKMIGCGDVSLGFIAYICMVCFEKIKIGLTCKSRFCIKCGKKYVSQWVEKQVDKILDVPHRHCVFTMPDEYRRYFYWHKESLKDLQDMSYEVVLEYVNEVNSSNRKEYNKKKKRKKGGEL